MGICSNGRFVRTTGRPRGSPLHFPQWTYMKCRSLPFNPAPTGIGGVAQGQVCCIHQTLTSGIETDTLAHPVHGIPKAHVSDRVGKANRSSEAGMPESLF